MFLVAVWARVFSAHVPCAAREALGSRRAAGLQASLATQLAPGRRWPGTAFDCVLGLSILSGVSSTVAFLQSIGLPGSDIHDPPESTKPFPDGAHVRIEIPSTEGPACLEAVLEEALRLDVPIHRVSQGSGVLMLTDAELGAMARMAVDAVCEVSLFARPNAGWDNS